MIVTTLENVAGQQISDTLGLVRGTSSWTRRVTKSYAGGIRSTHAHGLADLETGLTVSRKQAMDAAIAEAAAMGANAIVGLQTDVRELSSGVFMVTVTGTAVKTFRLPANLPTYRNEDVPPPMTTAHYVETVRASFEGSALRH